MRMYRFCTYALLVSVCVFLNLRCERTLLPVDSSEKINYLQGKTSARVIFKLFNRHNQDPISEAKVVIVGIDSATTDANGAVAFDSVSPGSYMVACSKSGYESILSGFGLTIDSNSNTVPIVSQSTSQFYLARKGAVVKGNLFYDDGERLYPADGAVIECRISNAAMSFQQPIISTTSDDGAFTFSGLPEYCTYTINTVSFSEGSSSYRQGASINVAGKAAGDTLRANDIVLSKYTDGNFRVLAHNLEKFLVEDSVMIEFSEAVNTEELTVDSIIVTRTSPSTRKILIKTIWKSSDKKLYIIPYDGAWDKYASYRLKIGRLESVTEKPLDNLGYTSYNFSPFVTGDLGDVEDLWFIASDTNEADYSSSSASLRWSRLENASSYEVYEKTKADSFWTIVTTVSDTDASLSLPSLVDSNHVDFMVLGKNSGGVSSSKDAEVVTVKDTKKPVIDYPSPRSTSTYATDNTGNATVDTVELSFPTSSYVSEPLDTTMKPIITVEEAGTATQGDTLYKVDPSRCFWEWTTTRTGILNIVVDPGEDGSYDSLFIDFRSIVDLSGNKADTTDGAGILKAFTR